MIVTSRVTDGAAKYREFPGCEATTEHGPEVSIVTVVPSMLQTEFEAGAMANPTGKPLSLVALTANVPPEDQVCALGAGNVMV